MPDFKHCWAVSSGFEGWLTREQARSLWDAASKVRAGGTIVEIGSHRGRSTSVIAAAAPHAEVVAIDPFDNPRWGGGPASRDVFLKNLAAAGVSNVRLLADLSTELRPAWDEAIDMLYIDGAHDYPTVADDFEWSRHVATGAPVFVHDAFSSLGVTRALYSRSVRERDLRYVGREGSLAHFVRRSATPASMLRTVAAGAWFLRNVAVKVSIRKGWQGPARVLGQPDMQYPY